VNKGGSSSNCKIIQAEFLHLMEKYTLPFSKPVKLKFLIFSEYSHQNKNFLSPIPSWSANLIKNAVRSSPDPFSSLLSSSFQGAWLAGFARLTAICANAQCTYDFLLMQVVKAGYGFPLLGKGKTRYGCLDTTFWESWIWRFWCR